MIGPTSGLRTLRSILAPDDLSFVLERAAALSPGQFGAGSGQFTGAGPRLGIPPDRPEQAVPPLVDTPREKIVPVQDDISEAELRAMGLYPAADVRGLIRRTFPGDQLVEDLFDGLFRQSINDVAEGSGPTRPPAGLSRAQRLQWARNRYIQGRTLFALGDYSAERETHPDWRVRTFHTLMRLLQQGQISSDDRKLIRDLLRTEPSVEPVTPLDPTIPFPNIPGMRERHSGSQGRGSESMLHLAADTGGPLNPHTGRPLPPGHPGMARPGLIGRAGKSLLRLGGGSIGVMIAAQIANTLKGNDRELSADQRKAVKWFAEQGHFPDPPSRWVTRSTQYDRYVARAVRAYRERNNRK